MSALPEWLIGDIHVAQVQREQLRAKDHMPKPVKRLDGQELDKEMRRILMAATKETVLSSAQALVELGFPGIAALHMVSDILIAKKSQA